MILYTGHDQILEVRGKGQVLIGALDPLLRDLSFVRTQAVVSLPTVSLAVRRHDWRPCTPATARAVFRAHGLCGFEQGEDFYLTDGASLLHLRPSRGWAEAQLAPAFREKPAIVQRQFWAFGVLKLLRARGLYSLHAAGLVSRNGVGLLLVGNSGCGKSTLTIGLVRQGWSYLSDDAVLLRLQPEGVEALGLRKHCYVNANAAEAYADLPVGEEVPDSARGRRRRVCIEAAFPNRVLSSYLPQVLLFPRIVPHPSSALVPVERRSALGHLLAQSGPKLFDRGTMPEHLKVLTRLVQQTSSYELRAGLDLYHDPLRLVRLLREVEGEGQWPTW
jgi:hypothetical protein